MRSLIFATWCALTFISLSPSLARATEEFPPVITGELGLDYLPDCGLCHVKGNTGSGTAKTPFALAMKERGLQPEDAVSVRSALMDLDKDGVDSDGDGSTDIEELMAGTNPNSPSDGATVRIGDDPQYGCSVRGSSAGDPKGLPLLYVLAGLVVFALLRARVGRREVADERRG